MSTRTKKLLNTLILLAFWAQLEVSAYTPYENPGTCNYNGSPAIEGITVASDDYPIGTKIYIADHQYTVLARMGAPSANVGKLDIFMTDYHRAIQFGRKIMNCKVEIEE